VPGIDAFDHDVSAHGGAEAVSATCFVKKGEFVSRNIAGETIVVPIRGRTGDLDAIYNLSEVAAHIWDRIDGHVTVRQLAEGVCAEFDVSPDTAEADTFEFIAELQHAGLIEPRLETGD
jgi:hypothetical protein